MAGKTSTLDAPVPAAEHAEEEVVYYTVWTNIGAISVEASTVTQIAAQTPREDHNVNVDDDWKQLARCRGIDPELFFPERGASTKEAKEVCRVCPVQYACLEEALKVNERDDQGIWGGMSARERKKIRRARSAARR